MFAIADGLVHQPGQQRLNLHFAFTQTGHQRLIGANQIGQQS